MHMGRRGTGLVMTTLWPGRGRRRVLDLDHLFLQPMTLRGPRTRFFCVSSPPPLLLLLPPPKWRRSTSQLTSISSSMITREASTRCGMIDWRMASFLPCLRLMGLIRLRFLRWVNVGIDLWSASMCDQVLLQCLDLNDADVDVFSTEYITQYLLYSTYRGYEILMPQTKT